MIGHNKKFPVALKPVLRLGTQLIQFSDDTCPPPPCYWCRCQTLEVRAAFLLGVSHPEPCVTTLGTDARQDRHPPPSLTGGRTGRVENVGRGSAIDRLESDLSGAARLRRISNHTSSPLFQGTDLLWTAMKLLWLLLLSHARTSCIYYIASM